MWLRPWVVFSVLVCVAPSRTSGAQAALPHESCTRAEVEDAHLVPCLRGEAGALSDAERASLLTRLRERASTHYDRVAQELDRGALVSDSVARHAMAEILVAHGMPSGAMAILDGFVDPPARLARTLRRRSRELRTLRITDCRVVPEDSTDTAVRVTCDRFVRCGPEACSETHASAGLWVEAGGIRVEHAATAMRSSSGACGDCM